MKHVDVMLVEDSPEDVELFKYCLKDYKIHVDLEVYSDGKEAFDRFEELKKENHPSFPSLVLLDINLPGMNGLELLEHLKGDPVTAMIPVVMLTSSKHEEDIISSYSKHANSFVQKPLDLGAFQKIVKSFEEFWFTIVTLPSDVRYN